jgi:CRP-like cAMP-binding protein
LDDVGSDKTEDGWVNWSKLEGLAKKIRDILRPGKRPYNLHPVPQIQKFIEEAEAWNDTKALYAISQLSEAKAPVGGAEASGFAGAARRAGGSAAVRRGMGARRSTVSNLQAFRQASTGSTGAPVPGAASDAPKEDPYALSEREWKILSAGATLKKFEANQLISDEGEDDRFMYRVNSGKVKVERVPPLEPEAGFVTLVTASEKDLIGEVALLKTHRMALSGRIVAVEPSEVFQLGVEFVLKICESESDLSEKLHRILALKLARRLRSINANRSRGTSSVAAAQDAAANGRPSSAQGLSTAVASTSMPEEDEAKKADEKFVKKFGLPSTEVIIRAMDCSLKQKVVSHGTMFVSQAYVCYSATVFGLKKKEVLPFINITKIENIANGKVIQVTTDSDKVYMFSSFDEPTETFEFLTTLWSNVSERQRSSKTESAAEKGSSSTTSSPAPGSAKKKLKAHHRGGSDEDNSRLQSRSASSLDSIPESLDFAAADDTTTSVDSKDGEPSSPDLSVRNLVDSSASRDRSGSDGGLHLNLPPRDRADSLASSSPRATEQRKLTALRARFDLTEEDWENILKGASVTTYSKDQPVITEGDKMQRIYQVGRGSCRIEKALLSDDKQKLVLGKFVKDDGVFGEISFLEGGAATASVVADEEETAVHIIEGYFLDVLFQRTPGLSGRFYHYLASLLAKRVAQREGSVAMPSSPRPNKPPPPIPMPSPKSSVSSEASTTTDSDSTTSEGTIATPTSGRIVLPPRSPEKRRSSHGSQEGTPEIKLRIRRTSESEDSDSQPPADVAELVAGEKKKKRGSAKGSKRRSLKVSDSTGSIPSSSEPMPSFSLENEHQNHHHSAPSPHVVEPSSPAPENDDEDSSSAKEKRGVKKMQKRNSKRSASMAPPISKIE